jgi:Rrf2 family iron-sulfur cluster assembly transcriptional regulator
MFLTTKTQYAITALLELGNDVKALHSIADQNQIDLPYLEGIFAKLKKNGLVVSFKGPGGGYQLAKPMDQIYIKDVIHAVDEKIKMTRCKDDNSCNGKQDKCKAHYKWLEMESHINQFISQTSLKDMLDD